MTNLLMSLVQNVLSKFCQQQLVMVNYLSGFNQSETGGAFHYAKLTGQRSVGIPEENGTTFSDKTGPTNRNGTCQFEFLFPN